MARYIDADDLIKALQVDFDREGEQSYEMAKLGLGDASVKYSHGQFCFLNAIERVKDTPTADVVPKSELDKKQQEMLHHLKRDLHEKAVYSRNKGIDSYIPLKVVDAIINNYLRDLEEKKHSE